MKNLFFLCLIVALVSCKDKAPEVVPDPDYSERFVGDYWTKTAEGGNSTDQTWVVTRLDKNLLGIKYTIDYIFRNQGKEIKTTEVYTLSKVAVLDSITIKINEDAPVLDASVEKVRKVEGEGKRIVDAGGPIRVGITFKFTDSGASTSTNSDYLEFKKN